MAAAPALRLAGEEELHLGRGAMPRLSLHATDRAAHELHDHLRVVTHGRHYGDQHRGVDDGEDAGDRKLRDRLADQQGAEVDDNSAGCAHEKQ